MRMAELENELLRTKGKLFVNRNKKPYEYLFMHKAKNGEIDFCVYFDNLYKDQFTVYKITKYEIPSLSVYRNDLLDKDGFSDESINAIEKSPVWEEVNHPNPLVPSSWRRIISDIEKKLIEQQKTV